MDTVNIEQIRATLRDRRLRLEMSQLDLAVETGIGGRQRISLSTIGNVEAGRPVYPRTIRRLDTALKRVEKARGIL